MRQLVIGILSICFGVVLFGASSAQAQQSVVEARRGSSAAVGEEEEDSRPWGFQVSAGVYSDYMFRGKTVYPGTSIQPSVTGWYDFGSIGSLSFNVWSHLSGETVEPPEKFTELDTTFSYDVTVLDYVNFAAGFIMYRFPGKSGRIADTNEYYLGLGANIWGNPTVTFYNDFDIGRYQYATLSFKQPFEIEEVAPGFALIPYTAFGFAFNANDGPVFYVDNGLVTVDVGLLADIPVWEFTLTPSINYTFEADEANNNEFWFGLELSYAI
ncbi:MAG: hypothetical protein KDD66_04070 [Bdellovibrionales bacterium]|nr:hypothetical protein [Bdellovibrionales bacterium]